MSLYTNRQLFSDHWLRERLPDRPEYALTPLALLYRLLFILYAESRALLPTKDARYREALGLRALIERLPARPDAPGQHTPADELPHGIWARLRRLFRALDDDERPEYVPAFNGRLFDRDTHPLLRDLTLADAPLAVMLALLGRTRDGRLIDYADLAVRQLGSIYEGLLEHQAIAVAVDEMVLVKGPKDKAPVIVPRADAGNRRVVERYPPGTVYLSNDKGERHAAGTYYTPEPVVRYLVDETLGPLVAGERADEILRLKVLGPAMGSGHFLVAAVDFLARAALAAEAESASPAPAAGRAPRSRARGAPAKPAARAAPGDSATESAVLDGGVLALKRRIAEQCIYGVDLNDAAVELAKLSLWLATAARGLPLTFLDAHLRAGNSLVCLAPGALEHAADPPPIAAKRRTSAKSSRASASSESAQADFAARRASPARSVAHAFASAASASPAAAQPALWDEGSFTQDMFRLVGGRQVIDLMDSRTAEDVRAKTHVLATLDPLAAPYRQVADLAVSRDFGNAMPPDLYAAAARTLLDRGDAARLPVLQGREIIPYACGDAGNRLLYPYRARSGAADLLPKDELRERYPLAWAYLNDPAVRAALEGREKGRFANRDDWYGYGRPQNMHLLAEAKLVLPDVAARGRAAYDGAGSAIVDTAYGVLVRADSPYARFFLLAALNSPILTFYLRHCGTDLRGGYFRMKTRYLEPFPLPPLDWAQPADERRAQAACALARIQAGAAAGGAGEAPEQATAALAHLPGAALHDVVAGLAERAGELATAEREAWRLLAARVAALRPGQADAEPVAALLAPRPGAAGPPAGDALLGDLLAALEQTGPALTVPELTTLRDAVAASLAQARTTRLIKLLLYRLYGLDAAAIALVEGGTDTPDQQAAKAQAGAANGATPRAGKPAQRGKRRAAGRGATHDTERERDERVAEEAEGEMRTVVKGGQPRNILTCLDVALERAYCAQGEMNRAMNYVEGSSTGSNYVALAWLAGLLDEHPTKGWLRPRAAGRAVVRAGCGEVGETARDAQISALWDALLALPGLRSFLEGELIELEAAAREQSAAQGDEIRAVWEAEFPAFAGRAAYLGQTLKLAGASPAQVRQRFATLEALAPLAATAARDLAATLGVMGGLSRLTRAQRLAQWLARAWRQPLRLDAEWLKSGQQLGVILLAAARERGLGCVVARAGAQGLAPAIEALARRGVDVRLETRQGGATVAALAQPVALCVRDLASLETLAQQTRGTPLEPTAGLILAAARRGMREAADGLARGALDLDQLAQACLGDLRDVLGEPAAHPAATEWIESPSRVTIGPPLPLPTDLSRLGQEYTFLEEAARVRAGRARPGVAVLLTEWLLECEDPPDALLASNPHLALLYLIAADIGSQADLLGRGAAGWTLDGAPLVAALDDRLRALGYEVWDERYAGNAAALGALGQRLVEHGLRAGILRTGGMGGLLDAPDSRWYFKAIELLAVAPVGRSMR